MCEARSPRLNRFVAPVFRLALLTVLALLIQFAARPAAAESLSDVQPAALLAAAPDLDPGVLDLALRARAWALASGEARDARLLSVIDYSLPSTRPRLWVFDLERRELLFHELVAHGRGSGENVPARFSNDDGSLQSSLGLFRTGTIYQGKNGYSLHLHGLESGVNDHAFARTIVMHGAWYVSQEQAERFGRIGRSWGCPAVRAEIARPLIDRLAGGSLLFAYYPQREWLQSAAYSGDGTARRGAGVTGVRTAAK